MQAQTPTASIHRTLRATALVLPVLALGAALLPGTTAEAYSLRVKMACASDYYAHCKVHSLSSPEVRQCMRTVGPALMPGCINALVAEGEVSKAEVVRRLAAGR
jgi:hypothetical protein